MNATSRSPRIRSHYRFRNRDAEYVSESCIKWMSGGTKRQCDRALRSPLKAAPYNGAGSGAASTTSRASKSAA
jgi:hypothetical protein